MSLISSWLAGFAGQNQDFAGDVGAAQVEARVGLGVAFGLGLAHDLGEGPAAVVVVEHEVEGARQHGFHAPHHVAAAQSGR
jgi:hypothetical protein